MPLLTGLQSRPWTWPIEAWVPMIAHRSLVQKNSNDSASIRQHNRLVYEEEETAWLSRCAVSGSWERLHNKLTACGNSNPNLTQPQANFPCLQWVSCVRPIEVFTHQQHIVVHPLCSSESWLTSAECDAPYIDGANDLVFECENLITKLNIFKCKIKKFWE